MRLPGRQVHLDFHTSPDIRGVGAAFDPDEFADTLRRARVNGVTCFARCHHGMLYYPSRAHPERIHPHLERPNLLGEQIVACRARGIRAAVYTTVQWDDFTAAAHRDWLCVGRDGKVSGTPPLEAGFYRNLDVFHPGYREFLRDHLADLFDVLGEVDGVFLDIVKPTPSYAPHWLAAMDAAGVDPENAAAVARFAAIRVDDWKRETTAHIRRFSADCTIFYNAGHVGPRARAALGAYTHLELESLPSGGWGYLHFPQTARYARTLGVPVVGQTGKFHTSWGDFHSYKNPAALQFECFDMLALGAGCSIGDQLHPSGKIDAATYDLIGGVYESVEAKEPWCEGAEAVVEIGVLTPEAFADAGEGERRVPAVLGAVRMLQELRLQFDVIDPASDISAYALIVLPDAVPVDEALAAKLEAYVGGGGKLLASGRSGLTPDGSRFALPSLGVKYVGDAPFSPDFLVPTDHVGRDLPRVGHVMYERGVEVEPAGGAEVLAWVEVPYFNRTWRHFCSHAHAPSSGEVGYPGVVATGAAVYFAHPVFGQYHANAPRWVKRLVADAVDRLLPAGRLVGADGPSSLIATLQRQPAEGRHVLHLLHYVPERRGAFDIIEDVIPLHDVRVSVRLPGRPASVRQVPEGRALEFDYEGGRLHVAVPVVEGHAMVEVVQTS